MRLIPESAEGVTAEKRKARGETPRFVPDHGLMAGTLSRECEGVSGRLKTVNLFFSLAEIVVIWRTQFLLAPHDHSLDAFAVFPHFGDLW